MMIYNGIGGAPGINRGIIMIYKKESSAAKKYVSFDEAQKKALDKVNCLHSKALSELGGENAKIFTAYKMLLEDKTLTEPIGQLIQGGKNPEEAVHEITDKLSLILSSKQNEYMRQRADDIRYVGQLLIDALDDNSQEITMPDTDEKIIVVAKELTPVDTMQLDASRLAGLVTEYGGITSHTVILAKSLGIPAVVGAREVTDCCAGDIGYIDGYSGEFAAGADLETQNRFEEKISDERDFIKQLEKHKKEEAHTKDGERISVCMNIGSPGELNNTEDLQYDGVGLFRSEFLYSSTSVKPAVDEQRKAYKTVIEKVYPCSVTIRTIDVGGDKQIAYLNMKEEENPFLGNRGIRLCIQNPDVFKEQLEAILTATEDKAVKIMLPMITSLAEIDMTREIIGDLKRELDEKNKGYCRDISLGIMIETPASAIMAQSLAKHCDFFSIGTNDLVQYITAADRGNADVEHIYNPYHPAVIRTLNKIIKAGEAAQIEVSVCGDLAANTNFTEALLGMGLKKFSVPSPMIARIKHKISITDMKLAKEVASKALEAESADDVYNILVNHK